MLDVDVGVEDLGIDPRLTMSFDEMLVEAQAHKKFSRESKRKIIKERRKAGGAPVLEVKKSVEEEVDA